MKKIAVILLTVSIMTSLVACGEDRNSATDAPKQTIQIETSDVSGKTDNDSGDSALSGEINTDISVNESIVGTNENKVPDATPDLGKTDANGNAEEIAKPIGSANPTETKNPDNGNKPSETAKPGNSTTPSETVKPSNSTKPTEPAKPEHKHSYTSEVTKAPVDGIDGVRTFICSCGDSYTEKIEAPVEEYVISHPLAELFVEATKNHGSLLDTEDMGSEGVWYGYSIYPAACPLFDYETGSLWVDLYKKGLTEPQFESARYKYTDRYDMSSVAAQINNDIYKVAYLLSDDPRISHYVFSPSVGGEWDFNHTYNVQEAEINTIIKYEDAFLETFISAKDSELSAKVIMNLKTDGTYEVRVDIYIAQ